MYERGPMEEYGGVCALRALEYVCGNSRSKVLNFDEFLLAFCNTPVSQLESAIEGLGRDTVAKMEDERMTTLDRVVSMGVSRAVVTRYLRKEIAEAEACFLLPAAMLMLACFLLSVVVHFPIERLHAADVAISWDIEETWRCFQRFFARKICGNTWGNKENTGK